MWTVRSRRPSKMVIMGRSKYVHNGKATFKTRCNFVSNALREKIEMMISKMSQQHYVYASPVEVQQCRGLRHPLRMLMRRVVASAILSQAPFQHGLDVSNDCYLEEQAFQFLDEENEEKRVCPSGLVCLFHRGTIVTIRQYNTTFLRPTPLLKGEMRIPMAAVLEADGSQVFLPDCSHREYHLSGPNRIDLAGIIFTHKPFLNTLRSSLPGYSCALEYKAGQYLTQPLDEEPMCPSYQRRLTCLTYRGPQANQSFSEVVSEAMVAWDADFKSMSNVVQLGCNYARRYEENEITCYFRSSVP